MTDIAIPNDLHLRESQESAVVTRSGHDTAVARLADWAQTAAVIHSLAERIVRTQFVPKAYRGKPDEAAAAMLAGAEVGISPMASLRAFHDINGTPAPAAITLRAVVQAHGHEVRIEEFDNQHAVVVGRRRGETDWQTSTWTIERAQQAGYVQKNPNWRSNPAAMLVARATAEVCRWVASDAIMGMPYSVEELRDQDGDYETQARPRPMRVTAAEILGTTELKPAPAPAHPREPDERSYLVDPGDVVNAEDVTVERALGWIAEATSQAELDEIKQLCQTAGIRDQAVLDAWTARSTELAEAA